MGFKVLMGPRRHTPMACAGTRVARCEHSLSGLPRFFLTILGRRNVAEEETLVETISFVPCSREGSERPLPPGGG